MLIQVTPGSPEPLFAQIARSVREQAASGDLPTEARLPSARDLAQQLGVNLHTVLKAYQLLRDEGLVELRRGRGAVLTAQATGMGALTAPIDQLLEAADSVGVGVEAVVALLRTRAELK